MKIIAENSSIDEVLRELIFGSDLVEVACCLDMIARETGYRIVTIKKDSIAYPLIWEDV
jgi:hypothetical protein